MFGFIVIDGSSDVIFSHSCQYLFKNKSNSLSNNYLMQILAPLLLSKRIFKSEKSQDFLSLRFNRTRMLFKDRLGFTLMAVGKCCLESELELFLSKVLMMMERLLGPDFESLKVIIIAITVATFLTRNKLQIKLHRSFFCAVLCMHALKTALKGPFSTNFTSVL